MSKKKKQQFQKNKAVQPLKNAVGTNIKQQSKPGFFASKWPLLLVLGITFCVFIPSLDLGFVNWDDHANILENKTLTSFASQWKWDNVQAIFLTHVNGNYNPLPIFTFAIEKYFFAHNPVDAPFIFHLNNLILHLICTWLVFLIFKRLGLSLTAAFIGALLFGIHPMRVESVAWITERKDVLYGAFFLGALLTYLKYIQSEVSKYKWYLFTIFISVFSYFSKIQAVTLPLSMVAIDLLLGRKWFSAKVLIIEKLPWWIFSLIFGLINVYFLTKVNTIDLSNNPADYGIVDRLSIGAYSYANYIIKCIYPFEMVAIYPYTSKLPFAVYLSLIIVPVLLGYALWRLIKQKQLPLIFGIAFFTFNVMFLLQIVGAGQAFLADRFTYIAYIGLFFLFAWFYDWIKKQKPKLLSAINLISAGYFVLLALVTVNQIKVWQNGGTLWEHAIKYYPENGQVWQCASEYYMRETKEYPKALEYCYKSILLDKEKSRNYRSLSRIYFDYGNSIVVDSDKNRKEHIRLLDSSLLYYNKAFLGDSILGQKDKLWTSELVINRGACKFALGFMEAGLQDQNRGLAINKENSNGYLNRGIYYTTVGDDKMAVKDFSEYLKYEPYSANIHFERGMCKYRLKQLNEGLSDVQMAFSLNSNQPLFLIGRAKIYKALGRIADANADIAEAKSAGLQIPPELKN